MKFSIGGTMNLSWEEARQAATDCEALGFEEFYASDHLMGIAGFDPEKSLLDAVALLLALAPVTKRIKLGCLVSPVTYRNPTLMLRQLQTLDLISAGRAIAGIGAGWSETEHRAFGFPFPAIGERLGMLEDACRLTRERWSALRPKPVQERLQMLIAGASPRVLRMSARYADQWHAIGTPAYLAEMVPKLRAAEKETGRDPGHPLETTVNFIANVSKDEAQLAVTRDRVARRPITRGSEQAQARHSGAGEANVSGIFVGTPEELRPEIERYAAAGVERIIFSLPRPYTRASLELLARGAGL